MTGQGKSQPVSRKMKPRFPCSGWLRCCKQERQSMGSGAFSVVQSGFSQHTELVRNPHQQIASILIYLWNLGPWLTMKIPSQEINFFLVSTYSRCSIKIWINHFLNYIGGKTVPLLLALINIIIFFVLKINVELWSNHNSVVQLCKTHMTYPLSL